MKKTLLLLLVFSLLTTILKAQDFAYGTFTLEDMEMQHYAKDTSAHAVVLNEYGTSRINNDNDDVIRLTYNYHVKIKIFDNSAFDYGQVEIPIYNDGEDFEEVANIKGITTYTNDDGSIKTTDFDAKKIYRVINNKHWTTVKFTMPGMKRGCTIEYTYTVYSRFLFNFHPWAFQWDIPKIHSEYEVNIPGFWNYHVSLTGALRLTKNVSDVETDCFTVDRSKSDCSHMVYAMDDIPAFAEEADMTSPKNFKSAINFELSEFRNPYDGVVHVVTKDWKDVDHELKVDENFGGQIKRTSLFKDRIAPVINGQTDDLQKAKSIYAYIQKNIKWNEINAIESENGIKKALDNHSGSIADINISLVTALDAAGLDADAVLLSTREDGQINKLYPVISDFNYVVCKLNIGDKSYLLDASDPLLSFGLLPLKCLNDQGRVMSLDKPSYWIDMNTPQRKNSSYIFDLTLQPDGKIKGTVTHYSIGYEAFLERKEIKKFNSVDEYIEDLDSKSNKFKIIKSDISGIDSLDEPLTERYEIEIKEYNSLDHSRLGFNPYIIERLINNPYKLAERTYPVDIGMPSVARYSLTMHLPDGYIIENTPQNMSIGLPNGDGSFITQYAADDLGKGFTFSHVIQLNKSVYQPDEYPYLKEFYNKVILSEKSEIIFSKKQ